jgi:FtsP/CotA-like multicopper oxidase with cupredoxin domain
VNRRTFLRLAAGAAAGAAFGGCSSDSSRRSVATTTPSPSATRSASPGGVRAFALEARPATVDIGGLPVSTWTYGGELPGRELRVRKGEIIEARLTNSLPADTTIHWHGLVLPNEMDGVPGTTQDAVAAGADFLYRFRAEVPGTYWFHPHTGLQLERGLYAPLIIEDPDDGSTYDDEWVVVLDDWLDGVAGATPDTVWSGLRGGMGHGSMGGMHHGGSPAPMPTSPGGAGMLMGAISPLLGGDAGDVAYPHYLVNGRTPADPRTFVGRPGQRLRIHIINAAGDTAFRVALGGHRMTVTHTDGLPVRPVDTDALLIGMGERYDVVVTLSDGVFPLVALAEGKARTALALLRTSTSAAPPPATARPAELDRLVLRYDRLTPADGHALASRRVDREHRIELTGGMGAYDWGLNGRPFGEGDAFEVTQGQRARLTFVNTTQMWHPMHLHGHTFQINGDGPRKDTAIVLPKQTVTCDFDAEPPGRWMIHCHNNFHLEAGGYLDSPAACWGRDCGPVSSRCRRRTDCRFLRRRVRSGGPGSCSPRSGGGRPPGPSRGPVRRR